MKSDKELRPSFKMIGGVPQMSEDMTAAYMYGFEKGKAEAPKMTRERLVEIINKTGTQMTSESIDVNVEELATAILAEIQKEA